MVSAEDVSADLISKSMKWVIFPDNSIIKCWDMIIFILVIYYLIVIPYQIGISASYYVVKYTWWFAINMAFDLIFYVDTFLYFFRAYHGQNGRLIFKPKTIRRHYLRGMFWINLISLMPSNLLLHKAGHEPLNSLEPGTDWFIDNAGFITLIKLFDLMKFARAFRLKFLLRESAFLSNLRQNVNSQIQNMIYYSLFLTLVAHWMACMWGLCVFLQTKDWDADLLNEPNWISVWYEGNYVEGGLNPIGYENDLQRYLLCIFWSIQTITSIGYGNIAPVTFEEWLVSSFLMIYSGFMWAYLIGGLVNIASALHEKSDAYGKMNDEANAMIAQFAQTDVNEDRYDTLSVQTLTAHRIKKYIRDQHIKSNSTGCLKRVEDIYPVYETLSPYLKGMSSLMLLKDDLEVVSYLSSRYLSNEQQAAVALECVSLEFGAGEICDMDDYDTGSIGRGIFVIKAGSALAFDYYDVNKFNSRLLSTGTELGSRKVLVEDGHPRSRARMKFLTFSRVTFIPRSAIFKSFKRNPMSWKECGRWKYALSMIMAKYSKGKKNLLSA